MSRHSARRGTQMRDAQPQPQTPAGPKEAADPGTVTLTLDAFQNALARMGVGMPDMQESTSYPLTRLTKNYVLMNSLYRAHWIIGRIVDTIPEDMCKNWYQISSQIDPEIIDRIQRLERTTQLKARILEGLRWGRLYGGAAGIMMIAHQEDMLDQPLDLDTVMPGSFKGIMIVDRWSGIFPGPDLVGDIGDPDFNLPAWYEVRNNATAEVYRVHHSRVLRFTGYELPNWERQAEIYWGASVVERVFEELRKRDNASYNIADLIFRANVFVRGVKDLDQTLATAPQETQNELYNTLSAANRLLNNFSMYVIDSQDTLDVKQTTFSGIADVYNNFVMDVAGAAEIPVTKLFGRSPAGLNATGESDMQNYYDMIESRQESDLRPVLNRILPLMFVSEVGAIPDDLQFTFPPVQRPKNEERAELAAKLTEAVIAPFNAGIVSPRMVLKELKQQEPITGLWSNITDTEIEQASDKAQGAGELMPQGDPFGGALEGPLPKLGESGQPGGSHDSRPFDLTADADFEERQHPRSENGEFTSGAGSSGSSAQSSGSRLVAAKPGETPPPHIAALKLPPAWTDVRYSPDPDADLLAIGKDAKGRAQYVYSERFAKSQAAAKFARIQELDRKFHYIREQNEAARGSKNPKVRDSADALALIFATGIRPGSDSDTKAKRHAYGATTLEGRHVVADKNGVHLQFVGKEGKDLDIPVEDPDIARMLRQRAKSAGPDERLFPATNDAVLRAHSHSLDGGSFKPKDFRTLLATREANAAVSQMPPPKDEKAYVKAVRSVAKVVSAKLGNTPAVALQSYIAPEVFAPWRGAMA